MKTTHQISRLLAALVLSLSLSSCCSEGFRNQVTVEPKEQWVGTLNPILEGMEIHLNNYQPIRQRFFQDLGRAYLIENDSYISLAGERTVLNIPVARQDPVSVYIDDINSQSISFDARDNRAIISIAMESDGREFWKNCVDNGVCGWIVPDEDVNVDDMIVEIRLDIIAESGKVTYNMDNIEVEVRSPSPRPDYKNALANNFKERMASEEIRDAFSNLLMLYVRDVMHIEEPIAGATVTGGDLLITQRVRDVTCDD